MKEILRSRWWLPNVLFCSLLCVALPWLLLSALLGACLFHGNLTRAASLAGPAWWAALGARVSLHVLIGLHHADRAVAVGTLWGSGFLSGFGPIVLSCAPFVACGVITARCLRARGLGQRLVVGTLVCVPVVALHLLLAAYTSFSDRLRLPHGVHANVRLWVRPLDAAPPVFVWALLGVVAGALVYGAWRGRTGKPASKRLPPAWRGAVVAVLLGSILSAIGSLAQLWMLRRDSTLQTAVGLHRSGRTAKVIAVESLGTAGIAVATEGLAFDCGAPIQGRVRALPGTGVVPADTRLWIEAGGVLAAQDVTGRVLRASPFSRWWLVIPWLSAMLGAMAVARGNPGSTLWWSLKMGLMFAAGVACLAAWQGAGLDTWLQMTGQSAGTPMPISASWRPIYGSLLWRAAALGFTGGWAGLLWARLRR